MTFARLVEMAIIEHRDAADLGELASALGEVYPAELVRHLERLRASGGKDIDAYDRLTDVQANSFERVADGLAKPHPVDSDWRLDETSRSEMASLLKQRAGEREVLLLGVPTVYQRLKALGSMAVLIDKNPALQLGLTKPRFFVDDIAIAAPIVLDAVCCFADPPWYPVSTALFIWYAAQCVEYGAELFLSIPGLLTRPGIAEERENMFAFAAECGFSLSGLRRQFLRYESPPFEVASLKAAGLCGFPQNWRTGDLAIFTKSHASSAHRPRPSSNERWSSRSIEGTEIRFRMRTSGRFAPTLEMLTPENVRRDVSSRDPLVPLIDVWTTGNQIFRSENPMLLTVIADALKCGVSPVEMIERWTGRNASLHERKLVGLAADGLRSVASADTVGI